MGILLKVGLGKGKRTEWKENEMTLIGRERSVLSSWLERKPESCMQVPKLLSFGTRRHRVNSFATS